MCYRVTIIRGGIKRTVICLPTSLYRLYCLVFVSIISNLRAMFFPSLQKDTHLVRINTPNKKKIRLPHLKSDYLQFHLWSRLHCCRHLHATPIYCWRMLTSLSCSFQAFPTKGTSPKRRALVLEVIFIFKYLRHRLITGALWVYTDSYLNSSSCRQKKQTKTMELAKRYGEATATTANTSISMNSLVINRLYPIVHAKRVNTKYGPTVLLSLRDSDEKLVQIFLPKRYANVVTDEDTEKINS